MLKALGGSIRHRASKTRRTQSKMVASKSMIEIPTYLQVILVIEEKEVFSKIRYKFKEINKMNKPDSSGRHLLNFHSLNRICTWITVLY